MRRFKLSVMVATVAAIVLTASAAFGAASKPKLSFVKTNASIGWSTEGGSSPAGGDSNANTQSLRINVLAGGGASAYTYGASEDLVGIRGLTLAQITHLGFDAKGDISLGAPRISLGTMGLDGAHTYFLSAGHCNGGDIGGGWVTADFIHDSTCEIFRDNESLPYANWAALVAAHGTETVVENPNDWFLIQDEPTLEQGGSATVYVDRLSVQEWCWTGNGTNGIINRNTGGCV